MDRRFIWFLLAVMILFAVNMEVIRRLNPPPEQPDKVQPDLAERRLPLEAPPPRRAVAEAELKEEKSPRRWIALGSADPQGDYRMVAVLSSRGASVEWVGLNDPQFRDLHALFYRRGFLGYLALSDEPRGGGARVNVVPADTPAANHLLTDDVITSISGRNNQAVEIKQAADVDRYLRHASRVREQVTLRVLRKDKPVDVTFALGSWPLEVMSPTRISPEPRDFEPNVSFLLTLAELGDKKLEKVPGWKLASGAEPGAIIESVERGSPAERAGLQTGDRITQIANIACNSPADVNDAIGRSTVPTGAYLEITLTRGDVKGMKTWLALPSELPQVSLHNADWNVADTDGKSFVRFERELRSLRLKLVKHYELAKREAEGGPAYHLTLKIEIINLDTQQRTLAYQIDGPQGLPTEGWWYSTKVSRTSGTGGARDLVYRLDGTPVMFNGPSVAAGQGLETVEPRDQTLDYFAVDTRSFAAAVMPRPREGQEPWIHMGQPLLVGDVTQDAAYYALVNTSFRLITKQLTLGPAGGTASDRLTHSYQIFVGPKDRGVLSSAEYGLEDLIYYGWPIFAVVARLMTGILYFFYSLIPNYGVAIILLTLLVRAAMFPLSRKQAIGAQKMQLLQPELKRLADKYKNNVEQRMKAQRELFRKHNYNPAGGCLLIFIQLPIFIGLYKGLSADINLRQAPLIHESIYWCSDLAAPDRLFYWKSFMPEFITAERGFLSLGPYFNLLPILTIVVFLWHQKLFMPPPTDEQQVLQQKMMKYMMIFMGFLFFAVPSGLCIYFIVSSLCGILERKLLPKTATQETPKPVVKAAAARPALAGEAPVPGASFAHDRANGKKKRKRPRGK
jgi:YidC/Oxa1 family membrane protein insertase